MLINGNMKLKCSRYRPVWFDLTVILLIFAHYFHTALCIKSSSRLDEIYKDCQDTSQYKRTCYGTSLVSDNCIDLENCDYLIVIEGKFFPASTSLHNGKEGLLIKSYRINQSPSLPFNSSWNRDFWIISPDEKQEYTYRCNFETSSGTNFGKSEGTSEVDDLFMKKSRIMIGSVVNEDVIYGCTWNVVADGENWPKDDNGKLADLIGLKYMVMLEKFSPSNISEKTLSSKLLPIYRFAFLYDGCYETSGSKMCFSPLGCSNLTDCLPLLIVNKRERDQLYLDFALLSINASETLYTVGLSPANGQIMASIGAQLSLRTNCGPASCRHKLFLPDAFETKMDEDLLDYSYSRSSGENGQVRRLLWSMPMIFSAAGHTFNARNTRYDVSLKVSNGATLVDEKACGLPGYLLRDEIFKECREMKDSQPSASSICFGFNKNSLDLECLECRTCTVIAVLRPRPLLYEKGYGYESEALELNLYGQDAESIGLTFDYDVDQTFGYLCSLREDHSSLTSLKGQTLYQVAVKEYGSLYCRWTISRDLGTWPLKRNGDSVNLIADPIPIQLTWNLYHQIVDANGSKNPVHRFKYIYKHCTDRKNFLCLGFNDCVRKQNCTSLAVISFDNSTVSAHNRGLLHWAVYAADDVDTFTVSWSSDNLYGDDYVIICDSQGLSDFYIWETGRLKNITDKVITGSARIEDSLTGFRCFWTMPGLFSVFLANYRFDVALDTVYMNYTFSKGKQVHHAARIFTTLPGFRNSAKSWKRVSKNSVTMWVLINFVFFTIYHKHYL